MVTTDIVGFARGISVKPRASSVFAAFIAVLWNDSNKVLRKMNEKTTQRTKKKKKSNPTPKLNQKH